MRCTCSDWTSLLVVSIAALIAGAHVVAGSTRLPSRFVPGDGAIAAAVNDQVSRSSVRGATVLAVWSDNRANSTGGYEGETSWDIYGMRFDASGNPLDTVPFAIAAGPGVAEDPHGLPGTVRTGSWSSRASTSAEPVTTRRPWRPSAWLPTATCSIPSRSSSTT